MGRRHCMKFIREFRCVVLENRNTYSNKQNVSNLRQCRVKQMPRIKQYPHKNELAQKSTTFSNGWSWRRPVACDAIIRRRSTRASRDILSRTTNEIEKSLDFWMKTNGRNAIRSAQCSQIWRVGTLHVQPITSSRPLRHNSTFDPFNIG